MILLYEKKVNMPEQWKGIEKSASLITQNVLIFSIENSFCFSFN